PRPPSYLPAVPRAWGLGHPGAPHPRQGTDDARPRPGSGRGRFLRARAGRSGTGWGQSWLPPDHAWSTSVASGWRVVSPIDNGTHATSVLYGSHSAECAHTIVHMTSSVQVDLALRRARVGVALLFLTNGALFANILPRYPEIKASLGLAAAP